MAVPMLEKPTSAMIEAGRDAYVKAGFVESTDDMLSNIYLAMEAARPSPTEGGWQPIETHGEHCSDYSRACRQCLDSFNEWKSAQLPKAPEEK